jgi:formylmethanofuran dehydrogenase subunit C
METVTLTMKTQPHLFLEADNISPDVFAGKKAAEIAALHAYEGRDQTSLGKYFEVTGDAGATPADTRIVVKGM